jgi:hypothetical protein
MTQDVDAFAMTVSYREDPPFVVSPLEPDNGDGAGGELLGEEVDCIEVELTGSLYDLFKDGCTFGELGSFVVGCMAVTPYMSPPTLEPLHPQVFVLATRNHENWDSYHAILIGRRVSS